MWSLKDLHTFYLVGRYPILEEDVDLATNTEISVYLVGRYSTLEEDVDLAAHREIAGGGGQNS